jgi:hypothetical protein
MIVSNKEKHLITDELHERLKDLIYIHGRTKILGIVDRFCEQIDPNKCDDKLRITYELELVSGDLIQIIGRYRRQQNERKEP